MFKSRAMSMVMSDSRKEARRRKVEQQEAAARQDWVNRKTDELRRFFPYLKDVPMQDISEGIAKLGLATMHNIATTVDSAKAFKEALKMELAKLNPPTMTADMGEGGSVAGARAKKPRVRKNVKVTNVPTKK